MLLKKHAILNINNFIVLEFITIKNINRMESAINNNNIELVKELFKELITYNEILLKYHDEIKKAEKFVSKYARLTAEDKENIIKDATEQMRIVSVINAKLLAEKYSCSITTIYNALNKYSKKGIRKR